MGKATAAASGPDNNKRLALLEAGVSALTMAMVANGVTVPEGADVHGLAITTIKSATKAHADALEHVSAAGARIAQLEEQNTALEEKLTSPEFSSQANAGAIAVVQEQLEAANKRIAELEAAGEIGALDAVTDLEGQLDTARKRVAELELEVAELETDVVDAMNEKNRLANLLSANGSSSTPAAKAEDVAEVSAPVELVRSESARDVGPTFGTLTADEIGAAVEAGAQFEVAFSNGEFELVEFGPVTVGSTDLHRFATQQWSVAPTIHIKGATAPVRIAGAGLLLEDVQVGWCAFDPAILVEPGQERAFNRALIF